MMSFDRVTLWIIFALCLLNTIFSILGGEFREALDDGFTALLCYRLNTGWLPK